MSHSKQQQQQTTATTLAIGSSLSLSFSKKGGGGWINAQTTTIAPRSFFLDLVQDFRYTRDKRASH